jgi:signal transduction histidine kinase
VEQNTQLRVIELERLISELRHDLRGAISPAALIADRLERSDDPAIRRSGKTIGGVVERILAILDATSRTVPPNRGPEGERHS